MDVSFVNPFINSTAKTFKTMLSTEIITGNPILLADANHKFDVSGVIGLSGEAQGVIALSFPKAMALKIVGALLRTDEEIQHDDMVDGIGEIANIVAGLAKQDLGDFKFSISLPNVVIGSNHKIATQSGVPAVMIPIKTEYGEFAIEVSLKTR